MIEAPTIMMMTRSLTLCHTLNIKSLIDNRKKEVSTKLWYSMIGRLATCWLSSSSCAARACAHAHIIFTAVSKRDALS